MKLIKTFERQTMHLFLKRMFFYFLLISIPVFITSFGIIVYTNHTIENEAMRMNESALLRAKSIWDTTFRQSKLLAVHSSIKTEVQMLMTPSYESVDVNKLQDDLRSFMQIYNYIYSVDIFSLKNGLVIGRTGQSFYGSISEVEWAKHIDYSTPNLGIVSYIRKDIYPYLLGIIKPVVVKEEDAQGAVAVLLDLSIISNIVNSSQDDKNNMFYILDDNYDIISTKSLEQYYGSDVFSIFGIEQQEIGDKKNISMIKNGEVISLTQSDQFPLYYLSVGSLNYRQSLPEDTRKILILVFILALTCSVVVSFLITYKSVSNINNLIASIKNPHGNKMVEKDLTFIVNDILMGSPNAELETELDSRIFLLQYNQATSLQAQMNPHFLRNTIDTINWMAFVDMGGQNRVSAALVTLSNLMCYSLYGENFTCTLGEEIEHAKVYIELLKLRYKDKFSVYFDVAANLNDCMVVRFILQPLIENSVYHGIKLLDHKGHIKVKAIRRGGSLVVTVRDNGVGISVKKAEEISARFDANAHIQNLNTEIRETLLFTQQKKDNTAINIVKHGIGIANIDMRIKLIFGNHYGVSITPCDVGGACVTVRLPFHINEKGTEKDMRKRQGSET